MKRASGVLMHISSLPNDFGIGSFGKSAYDFVDFLERTEQSYWQILPLTTTSYGDSPYQSFSAFAGNTHFIDFELLSKDGYLDPQDYLSETFGSDPADIDYGQIYHSRRPILEKAVACFLNAGHEQAEYEQFIQNNISWLYPFAEFMAIKEAHDNKAWTEWEPSIKNREPQALEHYRTQYTDQIHYHLVTQYFFHKQWQALKNYANEHHIQIIGDLPIYVAMDSVEMWHSPELFKLDEEGVPHFVAGTPPDGFSDEGQFWGNPIYNWQAMADQQYKWWADRLKANFQLYDIVRIDHFKGFESFWEIPFGSATSAAGHWTKGPGIALFESLKQQLGDVKIIAEDLGFMDEDVAFMRDQTGFPGMRILQFGFNGATDSRDLPHHYEKNCVVYVGTHDNMTALGWYQDDADEAQRDQMDTYLNRRPDETPAQALNRGIAMCNANTAIYTMQDLLDLDNRARMNAPNTLGSNWRWRMENGAITEEIEAYLLHLTQTYFRQRTNPDTVDFY